MSLIWTNLDKSPKFFGEKIAHSLFYPIMCVVVLLYPKVFKFYQKLKFALLFEWPCTSYDDKLVCILLFGICTLGWLLIADVSPKTTRRAVINIGIGVVIAVTNTVTYGLFRSMRCRWWATAASSPRRRRHVGLATSPDTLLLLLLLLLRWLARWTGLLENGCWLLAHALLELSWHGHSGLGRRLFLDLLGLDWSQRDGSRLFGLLLSR